MKTPIPSVRFPARFLILCLCGLPLVSRGLTSTRTLGGDRVVYGDLAVVGIETVDRSDTIYYAGGVYVQVRYSVRRTKGEYPSGAPRNVEIHFRSRKYVDAFFAPDRSEFRGKAASGRFVTVRLLDGEGNPTTGRPEYFELIESNGDRFRFNARGGLNRAFGALTEWQATGKPAQTLDDMGITILTDEQGVIRQVRTSSRTVVVETLAEQSYQLLFYHSRDVSDQQTDGFYTIREGAVPMFKHVYRNPDPSRSDSLEGIMYKDGEFESRLLWVSNPIGDYDLIEQTEEGEFLGYRTKRWSSSNNSLYYRIDGKKNREGKFESTHSTLRAMAGKWVPIEKKIEIGGEVVGGTDYTYIVERGPNYGKLKSKYTWDADWEAFAYDEKGRTLLEIRPVASQHEVVEFVPVEEEAAADPLMADLLAGFDDGAPPGKRRVSRTETRYTPEKPPENPEEAAQGRVTRYVYADAQATKPSESTLHQDGEFVSRSWFTYDFERQGRKLTREEISLTPDGKPGDPENEIRFSRP